MALFVYQNYLLLPCRQKKWISSSPSVKLGGSLRPTAYSLGLMGSWLLLGHRASTERLARRGVRPLRNRTVDTSVS